MLQYAPFASYKVNPGRNALADSSVNPYCEKIQISNFPTNLYIFSIIHQLLPKNFHDYSAKHVKRTEILIETRIARRRRTDATGPTQRDRRADEPWFIRKPAPANPPPVNPFSREHEKIWRLQKKALTLRPICATSGEDMWPAKVASVLTF